MPSTTTPRNLALRRRVAPFTPLSLLLEEPDGNRQIDLKLAFTMNAGAAIQEETGYLLTDSTIWNHIGEPKLFRAMLWGAALAHQPEYGADEGLETIGSYIQENNSEQILDALWKAYLAFLPASKREYLLKAKTEVEDRAKTKNGETPAPSRQEPTGSSSGPSPESSELARTNSAS